MQKLVPFVDLYSQYLSIRGDIDSAIEMTIRNSAYIGGSSLKEFEQAFAEYLQMKHVIGCANGTDSLEILLKCFKIGPGDEVIVPAISWISTSEAVTNMGAVPVFVDIDPEYSCMDVSKLEQVITSRTKAIIPVHLYGHPADMPAIMQFAAKHHLVVIEDCAQAHGAKINGKMVGSFGQAASFSFYPGKNLGAYGDAGCMATNDDAIAEMARMIAHHGQKGKHNHFIEGRNSRLDGLQAAILMAKLPHLERWTNDRIELAASYTNALKDCGIQVPKIKTGCTHVFHVYVIRVENRDAVKQRLAQAGIETAIHYPRALPFLTCYADRNYQDSDFPVAAEYQHHILSLPMFAELSPSQLSYVTETLESILVEHQPR